MIWQKDRRGREPMALVRSEMMETGWRWTAEKSKAKKVPVRWKKAEEGMDTRSWRD